MSIELTGITLVELVAQGGIHHDQRLIAAFGEGRRDQSQVVQARPPVVWCAPKPGSSRRRPPGMSGRWAGQALSSVHTHSRSRLIHREVQERPLLVDDDELTYARLCGQ